jgi:antitoxin HicB
MMERKTWTYPVTLQREKDRRFHAYSEDLPEAVASGRTEREALKEMTKAFAAAVRGRIVDGMDLPTPRGPKAGEIKLFLPPSLAAKASVYVAWKDANLSKVALAQRMGRSEGEVRRILDPHYGTKLDQLEEAAEALGGHLAVAWEPA